MELNETAWKLNVLTNWEKQFSVTSTRQTNYLLLIPPIEKGIKLCIVRMKFLLSETALFQWKHLFWLFFLFAYIKHGVLLQKKGSTTVSMGKQTGDDSKSLPFCNSYLNNGSW